MMSQGVRRRRVPGEAGSPPAYSVILDPGTTTLRLLSAELAPGQATVWGWAQGPMPPPGTGDPQQLLPLLEELLNKAEWAAESKVGQRVVGGQLVVGLPASQLRGWSWSVSQQRSQPVRPVDERELGALLGRASRLAISRLQDGAGAAAAQDSSTARDPSRGSGWVAVDQVCVFLSVDDHGVTDPVGFAAERMGAMVFAALASVATIEAWRTIASRLGFSTLLLAATPVAQVSGLSDPEGLLIDVGGATTDLVLWRAARPVALQSVPVGGESLTAPLIQAWGLSPARARELKGTYASGQLPKEAKSQILQAILPGLRAWFDEVEQGLSRFCELGPLPHRLFLSGGGSVLPEMAEAARALVWSEQLAFTRYPEITRLQPTSIPHVLNRTDEGREAGDVTALALAAWAAEQVKPLGRPARVLNEMCEAERFISGRFLA